MIEAITKLLRMHVLDNLVGIPLSRYLSSLEELLDVVSSLLFLPVQQLHHHMWIRFHKVHHFCPLEGFDLLQACVAPVVRGLVVVTEVLKQLLISDSRLVVSLFDLLYKCKRRVDIDDALVALLV